MADQRIMGTLAHIGDPWRSAVIDALSEKSWTIAVLAGTLVHHARGVRCAECGDTVRPTPGGRVSRHDDCPGGGRPPLVGLPRQYVTRLLSPVCETIPICTYLEICTQLGLSPGEYCNPLPEVLHLIPAMGRRDQR